MNLTASARSTTNQLFSSPTSNNSCRLALCQAWERKSASIHTLREALDVKYLKPRQPLSWAVTTCTLVMCLEYKCSQGEELSFVRPSLKRALELLLFAFGWAFLQQCDA